MTKVYTFLFGKLSAVGHQHQHAVCPGRPERGRRGCPGRFCLTAASNSARKQALIIYSTGTDKTATAITPINREYKGSTIFTREQRRNCCVRSKEHTAALDEA